MKKWRSRVSKLRDEMKQKYVSLKVMAEHQTNYKEDKERAAEQLEDYKRKVAERNELYKKNTSETIEAIVKRVDKLEHKPEAGATLRSAADIERFILSDKSGNVYAVSKETYGAKSAHLFKREVAKVVRDALYASGRYSNLVIPESCKDDWDDRHFDVVGIRVSDGTIKIIDFIEAASTGGRLLDPGRLVFNEVD